jgi:hypothetical protein
VFRRLSARCRGLSNADVCASAIAVNAAYTQIALFAGPALARWLIAVTGSTAFAVNVLGSVVDLGSIALLRTLPDYQRQTIMVDRS